MKKQYFYASLFVSAAKGLAVLTALIGIGFCVLRYYQTSVAAAAIAYQPSPQLQQALSRLKDAFLTAEQIAKSFNDGNQSTTPGVDAPRFPPVINSTDDFSQIAGELSRVDQERQQLKESIVSRFETLVKSIEEKLNAYVAVLLSRSPSPAPGESLITHASPSPSPIARQESLFSSQLATSRANERRTNLSERKEFLKALANKAENADNRLILGEAADQLDRLAKLLPKKLDASPVAQPDATSTPREEPQAEQGGELLPSERVARQLQQLRGAVRQILLTSWILDDAFEQAANLNLAEQEKYRAAMVAQTSIWLSTTWRILIGLLATGLASLMIVVLADLVRTQLDTATSSSSVADAINSLRGSVTNLPAPEPPVEEAVQVHKNGEKRAREDSKH